MIFSKRMLFLASLLTGLMASALLLSCDLGTNGSDDDLTVTYNAGEGGGTAPDSQSVASGTSITLPDQGSMTAPEKKIFAGWSAGGQTYAAGASYAVTADVTFTAQWVDSIVTYTITYSAGGGGGTAPDSRSVASGTSITLPAQGSMTAPEKKTFAGWSAGGQTYAAGASYAVTADVTFTAQWVDSIVTYTIPYSAGGGGGTAPASQLVASGVSIALPDQGSMTAPEKKIFAGWSADGQTYAEGTSYAVTANVTFTAQWDATYTVTYDLGGGGGTAPAPQSGVVSGTSITLPDQGSMTAPEKKTFAGWSADGQAYAAGASYAVTADVTFIAQWAVEYQFEAGAIFVGYMASMGDGPFPIYIIITADKGFEVRSYYGLENEVLRSRGTYAIAGNGITLTQSELLTSGDNTPIPFPVYTFTVDAHEDGVIRTFSGEDFRWPLPTMGSVGGSPRDADNNEIERFTFNVVVPQE
jgi:hypothetical protein